jgi:hypothetical protein
MRQLVVNDELNIRKDSENGEMNEDELNNYRGHFHAEEEPEERYYEHGAHFPYKYLFKKMEDFLKNEPGRRETVEIRRNSDERNKVLYKHSFTKNVHLNVSDNISSYLKNSIKSRNQEARASDKTPIVKTTFTKQLTIGKKKNNMYTSYSNEVKANSTSKKITDKFTFEKKNPITLVDKKK